MAKPPHNVIVYFTDNANQRHRLICRRSEPPDRANPAHESLTRRVNSQLAPGDEYVHRVVIERLGLDQLDQKAWMPVEDAPMSVAAAVLAAALAKICGPADYPVGEIDLGVVLDIIH